MFLCMHYSQARPATVRPEMPETLHENCVGWVELCKRFECYLTMVGVIVIMNDHYLVFWLLLNHLHTY